MCQPVAILAARRELGYFDREYGIATGESTKNPNYAVPRRESCLRVVIENAMAELSDFTNSNYENPPFREGPEISSIGPPRGAKPVMPASTHHSSGNSKLKSS